MNDLRTAAQQALEAWQRHQHGECPLETVVTRFEALRDALAQEQAEPYAGKAARINNDRIQVDPVTGDVSIGTPQTTEPVQEPVAWYFEARHIDSAWAAAVTPKHPGPEGKYMRKMTPLYAAPPQRKPLTENQIVDATEHIDTSRDGYFIDIARAVERAHGIGGQDE